MRELALVGCIALAFGLGSYYATGELGAFGWGNLAAGSLALVVALGLGARRLRGLGTPAARRVLAPHLLAVAAALAGAVALERAAAASGLRLDWTLERRFELAPATRAALAALPGRLRATLFHEKGDPRARRTRLLLETLARAGPVEVQDRLAAQSAEELDRFGVLSTNAVVLQLGERFETVNSPTEGALYEGVMRLEGPPERTIYAAFGEGERDLESEEPAGYSGIRSLLETEGYTLKGLVTAAAPDVPADAAAVLVLGPERALRSEGVAALARYLARGGRLVALLEPGVRSGLEELLGRWGFELPDGVVVDPLSGPLEGAPSGVNPVISAWSEHPITRGLGPRTLVMMLRARPVLVARKPEPDDALTPLAWSSPRSWLARDARAVQRGAAPLRPADTTEQRFTLLAAGRYPRPAGETRIVVFGDADFVSNQYARALYDADLFMNAVHWSVDRESAITLRPKVLTPDQDPLTPQQSLAMFYGVGLFVPELLLVASALAWLRRRGG